jgi:3-deoxy-D-manno-octulosonate 8-phosphate phosphatase (KDO 8-P phosphatase)
MSTPREPRFAPELLLLAQGRAGDAAGGAGGAESSGDGRIGPIGLRAAIFDVDGVLTDGRLYIGEAGEVFKAFHVLDGHGLKLLVQAGITPIVITGRDSPAVRRRMADLGLSDVHFGISDKLAVAQRVLAQRGLVWGQVAVIGDDWPDLPLLARAGFACAPANAHVDALALAHHITTARGGEGAAREFCDLLLMANGHYAALLQAQQGTLDGR